MDHKKEYEQTIASKLEALPLPDMANAIWSRIETQLDMDMPADDGGGNEPGSPSGGNWSGRAGLFVFIAAFVAIFLLYKNNKKTEPLFQPEQTTQPAQAPSLPETRNSIPNERSEPETSLPENRSADQINKSSEDSATNITTPPVLLPPDSVQQTTVVPLPSLPIADTIQSKRKTRGVTGITDNDYRIVPAKKDST
jgi:hypothetical protein